MITFGPIEGNSEKEVRNKLDSLYTPNGYKITKWKENTVGFFRKRTIHSAEGYLIFEEKNPVQKSKEELLNSLAASKNNAENKQMMATIKDLDEHLKQFMSRRDIPGENQWDGNVLEIRSLLEKNDFTPDYINEICRRIHETMPQSEVRRLDFLKEKVIDWIAEDIKTEPSVFAGPKGLMKILIFLGPTGVGKTTTIVKMAASFASELNYVLFTTDNYKIGAVDQMEKFAELLNNVKCVVIRKPEDMKVKFWEASAFGRELVFVDTPGFSPTHYTLAAEVRTILEPCKAEAYPMLLIPAYTRFSDMVRITEEFEPFNYKGIVFSKFDESSTVGTIISLMKKTGKPALFYTTGQNAAADIETATKEFLLNKLIGFGSAGQFR